MSRSCLDCGGAPQETPGGLCRPCQDARVERVRANIRGDDSPPASSRTPSSAAESQGESEESERQTTLETFTT